MEKLNQLFFIVFALFLFSIEDLFEYLPDSID